MTNPQGAFLMHVETGQCFVLNALAARICTMLKHPTMLEELEAKLCADFRDVSPEQIDADTRNFLSQLHARHLVRHVDGEMRQA